MPQGPGHGAGRHQEPTLSPKTAEAFMQQYLTQSQGRQLFLEMERQQRARDAAHMMSPQQVEKFWRELRDQQQRERERNRSLLEH
jgi:hypothetical protein